MKNTETAQHTEHLQDIHFQRQMQKKLDVLIVKSRLLSNVKPSNTAKL
ncbi:hypothetical protein CHRY9393_01279 [Chryseobacterium fistulae]|uniref:Uncharacterized protein n=1 Tax=Chryseobacterium fistulae TaxID=2675058 RepID=A0A6N4XM68_9FLAO|nr:hypothetical protein CHRY9393_01279 [Chryseobacterium fistulae]